MSNRTRNLLSAAIAVASLAGLSTAALADTTWQKDHPRRAQVNHRLANQNQRIHRQVKDGNLTHVQAVALHKDDHQVRQEERDMASQNGGHITGTEQKVLNQQESGISHQIGH